MLFVLQAVRLLIKKDFFNFFFFQMRCYQLPNKFSSYPRIYLREQAEEQNSGCKLTVFPSDAPWERCSEGG